MNERQPLGGGNAMISVGLLMLACLVAITLFGTLIAPYNPSATGADSLAGPSAAHWLGTDSIGRDLLSRLIVGGRTTLLITFVAVTLAVCGGLALG
ncbi:MAG: ABC transporter permease, partial [Betaproteobacteria bacterium]|nr:ABC transporter permease [Betaproteobacteria bacterium]NDE74420.1 ABC transporter permease [Betaproteobacteria bacterium]